MPAMDRLFPQPQEMHIRDEFVRLVLLRAEEALVSVPDINHDVLEQACLLLEDRLGALGLGRSRRLGPGETAGQAPHFVLRLNPEAVATLPVNSRQGYILTTQSSQATVTAATAFGLYHGVQTLTQLLEQRGGEIGCPELQLRDWPDMAYRGIFAESRWGTDLMGLPDWQRALDYLAALKFNVLTIGIYNCWPIQYNMAPSEYLYVPLRKYPHLKTPFRCDYYSAVHQAWQAKTYLPVMFDEDLFGQVANYGRQRGIIVRPHWNGPGHTTLIPRLVPECSAVDEHGEPTGYGYCLSRDATYQILGEMLDEVIARYLEPNGIDHFHIAADEVYPLVGVRPDKPYEKISPWCRCDLCRDRTEAELYVNYITRLARHLNQRGIKHISMWCDQLVRGGSINEELKRRFDEEGLTDKIILHWWKYHDFYDNLHPELGLRRWVTPMSGYFFHMAYRSYLDNTFLALKTGHEQGAEGAESYCIFDPAFDRNYCALAEYAWNFRGAGPLPQFRDKYARRLFGDHWREGLEGFRYFDSVVDSPPAINLLFGMLSYGYNYAQNEEAANIRENYPQWLLKQLLNSPERITASLASCGAEVRRARKIWERDIWLNQDQQRTYLIECRRIELIASAFHGLTTILRSYEQLSNADLEPSHVVPALQIGLERLAAMLTAFDSLFADIEHHRPHYLVPQTLRELSLIRRFVEALLADLDTARDLAQEDPPAPLPDLQCMQLTPVPWVG